MRGKTSGYKPSDRPTHSGCDYVDAQRLEITPRGVDIISIADGEVTRISKDATSGNFIYIKHSGNIESFYCHLRDNSISVKVGDKIKKEQVIAVMGKTGNVVSSRTDIPLEYRGTHLHFGIRLNGVWVDPTPYLTGAKTISSAGSTATVTPASPAPGNSVFKANDKVKINSNAATYTTGQNIPNSVKNNTYTIQQISNDKTKVLLKEIVSWVFAKDVTLVSSAPAGTAQTTPQPAEPPKVSAAAIKANDKVKVKQGAKTYTGGGIASWVFNDTWVVYQVVGDRAVIDKNVSGKNSIMTSVNVKDLILA